MNLSIAKTLKKLIDYDEINGSEFKNKKFLKLLEEESIVKVSQISKTRTKIILNDYEMLDDFLGNEYNIKDLDYYIKVMDDKSSKRSDLVKATGDTKTKNITTISGLYINGYENFQVEVNNEKFNISNILNNTSFFIHKNNIVKISKDILIVGVENMESLLLIQKQKNLFENYSKKKLFIFINPSMLKLIENLENEYLHFGDFDLAGISIYETKIKPKIKNSNFFVPTNIEKLIINGNKNLYQKQYEKYKNIKSTEEKVQDLINLINENKRVIEQELLI